MNYFIHILNRLSKKAIRCYARRSHDMELSAVHVDCYEFTNLCSRASYNSWNDDFDPNVTLNENHCFKNAKS